MIDLMGIARKQIDAKGRISIPKRMRAALEDAPGEIVLLKMDDCIQLYPLEAWDFVQGAIRGMSPLDPRARAVHRLWGMNMDRVSLDAEGRIVLTRDQKEYAGIRDRVVIVGAINRIEIWAMERWEAMMESAPKPEEIASEVIDEMRR